MREVKPQVSFLLLLLLFAWLLFLFVCFCSIVHGQTLLLIQLQSGIRVQQESFVHYAWPLNRFSPSSEQQHKFSQS